MHAAICGMRSGQKGKGGDAFSPEKAVEVVVRPEAVDLVDPAEGDLETTVGFSHYIGSIVLYSLILPD